MSGAKQVFLSYAHEDRLLVEQVYLALKGLGLEPWMDLPPQPYKREGLQPGQDWEEAIRHQLATANVTLVFFSRQSVTKRGFVQREYRLALGRHAEKPVGEVFLVPVLIEPCDVPAIRVDTVSYDRLHYFRLYQESVEDLASYIAKTVKLNLWRTLRPGRRLRGVVSASGQEGPLKQRIGDRPLPPLLLHVQKDQDAGGEKALVDRTPISAEYVMDLMLQGVQDSVELDEEGEPVIADWGWGVLDAHLAEQVRSVKLLSPVAGRWDRSEAGDHPATPINAGTILGRVVPIDGSPIPIQSPMEGAITRFLAHDGDYVEAGEGLYLFREAEDELGS